MARKVAIVEDDFDQRENYADALTQSGYEVSTYANRPLALEGMKNDMPDLAASRCLGLFDQTAQHAIFECPY